MPRTRWPGRSARPGTWHRRHRGRQRASGGYLRVYLRVCASVPRSRQVIVLAAAGQPGMATAGQIPPAVVTPSLPYITGNPQAMQQQHGLPLPA